MRKIAITGSIASGKSYIAKIFKNRNISTYISDDIISDIYLEPETIDFIAKNFPSALSTGAVNKKILGDIVFAEMNQLRILEEHLIPIYTKKLLKIIIENSKKMKKIIVVEVPLLFENNLQRFFDYVITVECDDEVQKNRALSRNNMSLAKFKNITKAQISRENRNRFSNIVFDSTIEGPEYDAKINNFIDSLLKRV